MIDAVADFLIAGEADADRAVRHFRMRRQILRRFHDDGDAGLVVGAQQRGAVGCHQRFALHAGQFRVLGDAQDLGRVAGQNDVPAVVVAMDDGVDALAAGFRRGVEMSDPRDGGGRLADIARQRGQDDAVLIGGGVANAHGPQFIDEQAAEFELAGRAGIGGRCFVGLGVDANVTAEAVKEGVHNFHDRGRGGEIWRGRLMR